MNHLQTGIAPAAVAAEKANPDVIVSRGDQTALFQMKNRTASEWMRKHYSSATGKITGHTEIYVHPTRCKRIVEELKAAGFQVAMRTPNEEPKLF
jgi:hypothetical protein